MRGFFNKDLSIITNFGCSRKCYYCIWKSHSLKKVREKTNWGILEKILKEYNREKISISGGGDPLFCLKDNLKWYRKLFGITGKYGIKVDIHTALLTKNEFILYNINKYVFHSSWERFDQEKEVIEDIARKKKFRINFVLTDEYAEEDIMKYIKFCQERNIQLSFRELVGNRKCKHRGIKDLLAKMDNRNGIKYIKQDDYNIYFMPDNKLYDKFIV